jgi:hypothetical protein
MNKLLLHVLKQLCTPDIGEDSEQQGASWDKLPEKWLDYLDDAVHTLNNHLLPVLKFSPKELLLGLVMNTPQTMIKDSTLTLRQLDVLTQMAYVEQQCLDGYKETVSHVIKCKMAFDKRILWRMPGEVIFKIGEGSTILLGCRIMLGECCLAAILPKGFWTRLSAQKRERECVCVCVCV